MELEAYLCRYHLNLRNSTFRIHFQVKAAHAIFVTVTIVMLNTL
jgi:hypothetical protein